MIALKHAALIVAAFLLTTASGLHAAEVKMLSLRPDLDAVEPLTSKTFRQLVDEARAANKRDYNGVTLVENGKRYYLDLRGLQRYLRGGWRSWSGGIIENPVTKNRVSKGEVAYWYIPTGLS